MTSEEIIYDLNKKYHLMLEIKKAIIFLKSNDFDECILNILKNNIREIKKEIELGKEKLFKVFKYEMNIDR